MRSTAMPHGSTKRGWPAGVVTSVLALVIQLASAMPSSSQTASSPPGASCPGDNGGITLPKGFCATIFADGIGHARQLVVAPEGTVYVNTWSGVYYRNDKPPPGGFLVALKDTKGAGHADVVQRFGETFAEGHPCGCVDQTLAIRIVACPFDKHSDGCFGVGLGRFRHRNQSQVIRQYQWTENCTSPSWFMAIVSAQLDSFRIAT